MVVTTSQNTQRTAPDSCVAAVLAHGKNHTQHNISHPSGSSPIAQVDPIVRAVNTFMYGMLVHFGTLWMYGIHNRNDMGQTESCSDEDSYSAWIWCTLLLHEYWVYLQHSNVLANPYCQRLDRQYGIALLKSNQHWAIAGTLSAYWCRESLCMFLCLAFLQNNNNNSYTKYWIAYSLVYHTIKSRGVRRDALRRYSPTFGIMRVVIDKFYLHSKKEALLTLGRLVLQGIDTYIHHVIIRDLLLLPGPSRTLVNPKSIYWLHFLFVVWVVHAALNQFFRCSTASIMVQAWYSMTARRSKVHPTTTKESQTNESEQPSALAIGDLKTMNTVDGEAKDDDDDSTEAESISSHGSSGVDDGLVDDAVIDEDFIVRKLLRKGRLPEELEGRQGTATDGVDTAVRIETACAIVTVLYILGLDRLPLHAIAKGSMGIGAHEGVVVAEAASVTWLLGGLLHGIWATFVRAQSSRSASQSTTQRAVQRAIVNALDLAVVIMTAIHVHPSRTGTFAWPLAVGVTIKSYLQATWVTRPQLIGHGMKILEFGGKLLLLRTILATSRLTHDGQLVLVESYIVIAWVIWVIVSPVPTRCELASTCAMPRTAECSAADVVFLGHPAELIDCWALWLLPYSVEERWQGPFWAIPLWPLHYLAGWYVCNYRQVFFGDKASFFCCDDVNFGGTRMQTWTAAHFGRHFVTHPSQVKRNIEAAARHAERTGVRVLCLGALNKAESINAGGVGVVKALGDNRTLSVIHGNHLTAAAVVETTVNCFGGKAKVFLTGASSKVGWAVAQALRDRYGYHVLCHSTDAGRRKFFEDHGFESTGSLSDGTHFSHFWIVGKYDLSVPKLIPQNATAVVFSVPHALGDRSDVRVIEAGTLHMDLSKLDRPRQFTNKLKGQEIFACHAASVVANHRLQRDRLQRIDETGPVDPNTMDSWLVDAKNLGFHVPSITPVAEFSSKETMERPPIIVVGAGPAGLAVAASLVRQRVPVLLLERQTDPTQFGSWEHHFTGLEVTSQKKWCNLPWFAIPSNEFPGETIAATEYRRYLQLYASRFGLEIRRGVSVTGIQKGLDAHRPWTISYTTENRTNCTNELIASAVIVATGKHRVPNRDTSDFLSKGLSIAGIRTLHSTDLRDDASWNEAIQAARGGRLAIVGFGNSAADIATSILQKCPNSNATQIHIAARTVPPVFPRRASILRVDTIGYYLSRWLPSQILEDIGVKLLWSMIPSSRQCNAAFPAHLPRWSRICGRVPVIDKYGAIRSGFQSGRLIGHGPVVHVDPDTKSLMFDDHANAMASPNDHNGATVTIDMVIMATGYDCTTNPLVTRADPLNGLHTCGFGNNRFLPLQSIGEEAQTIAKEIVADWVTVPK